MAERHPVVESIYRVASEGAEVTPEQADEFGKSVSDLIAQRLNDRKSGEKRKFTLRMSNIGRGARQLWYDKRYGNEETLPPHTTIKFMFGDIIEQLLLFLAEVGGHNVTARQAEVALEGIKGHIDADIDNVTVDVKSASTFAFQKFERGTLPDDDQFGYMEQIAGYSEARNTDGAFLAMDKQNGHVTYLHYPLDELKRYNIIDRIKYLKEVLDKDEPPERCYDDKPEGLSGNRALDTGCSYCPHKERCWADANNGMGLRTFLYANKPKFLTKVVKEPKVHEVTF